MVSAVEDVVMEGLLASGEANQIPYVLDGNGLSVEVQNSSSFKK